MPKVQTYQSNQVQSRVVQGARASVPQSDNSGAILQGASQALGAVTESINRLDQSAAEEAAVKFERQKNDMFFNADNGYFNTQGRDAYDQAPAMGESLEQLKRQFGETLTSPQARAAFDKVADQHITRSQQDIARHSSKHLQAWEVATINSQVENTLENASLYWSDSERLGVQRALGRQSILDAAGLEGASPETTQEKLQNFESSFAGSAITAAIASSSTEGQATLEKFSKALEGPDLLKMQTMLERKQKAERSAADSQIAVLKAGNLVETYGDQDNAKTLMLEQVNKISDPEERSRVMKETVYQFGLKKQADSEARAATFETVESHIFDGGSVGEFIAQNPDEWEALSAKQKRSLTSGQTVTTDYNAYYELINQPVEQLANTTVTEHFHQLDPAHRQKLQSAVASARKGLRDGETTRGVERKQRLQELTGMKTPKSKKEISRYNNLNRTLDAMIGSKQKESGKDFLSDAEYDAVLSDFSKKFVKERRFWFDDDDADLTDIDPENLDAYTKYLRDNGIQVTTDTIALVDGNDEHRKAALGGK